MVINYLHGKCVKSRLLLISNKVCIFAPTFCGKGLRK